MANIAIIEYPNNIDQARDYFPPRNSLYLSVSAEASCCLVKKNIKFLTDEEVLSPQEFKKVGDENFEILERWVEKLEETLQSKSPIFKEREFTPFKWHFYRLKVLLDAVVIRRMLIDRLIERERPLLIGVSSAADPAKIHDHGLFFHRDDSLYGLLVQKIAKGKGIEIKTWDKEEKSFTRNLFSINRIRPYLRRLRNGLRVSRETRHLLKSMQSKDNILVGNLGYDIIPIIKALSDKYNFYCYENPVCTWSLNFLLKLRSNTPITKLPEVSIEGIFRNINVTGDSVVDEILGQRVQSYAGKFIPFLWKGLDYLESLDHNKKFKAYIDSVGASDSFYGLVVHYFMRKGKPVIAVQHGAYGLALNRHTEYCEFGHDGWFLAWGEGIGEMYEGRKKGSCKIISTGSHLIEEIKKKSKPRKSISKICYVPGGYRGYTAYYPNGQPCLDSKVFIMETNFLLTLKPYLKRYHITYKVFPKAAKESLIWGKSPMLAWVRENLPPVLIELKPLPSIINNFDLFIVDWPSTTLLQVCATGAEVMVYLGNKYQILTQEAMELLRRRAITAENEDEFQDKIRKVLDRGLVISDVEDTSFLQRYGIHRDDGGSLQRMADSTEGILRGKKKDLGMRA